MAHVEDRWTRPGPSGRRVHTDRYGRGLRWQAIWQDRDGQRHRRGFPTKDAAAAHLARIQVDQHTGTYASPALSRLTVAALADRWLTEQVHQRPSSLETIRRRLSRTILPTLGHHQVAQVSRATVQTAVATWHQEGLAASTIHLTYVYLAGIMQLAVDEHRIPTSPCRRINLPPVERLAVVPLTVAQVQALTDALWTPYQPMAVLAAATGMRAGELRGLTWDRIEHRGAAGQVRIDRQLTGLSDGQPVWGPPKTQTSVRVVGIGPEVLGTLERTRAPSLDGLVFTSATGRPLSRGHMSGAWRHAAPLAGLPAGLGWHALRHFHASLRIAGGASPVAVAHRLGHKDASETLRTYAHLWVDDDDRMRDATDALIRVP